MRRFGGISAFLVAMAWPVLAQEPFPTAPPGAPPIASEPQRPPDDPTVSSPPPVASPAAGGVRQKPGVVPARPVSLVRNAASTVTGYEKGKSLTVKTPAGTLVTYRLAKDASAPEDLSPGRTVLVETKVVKNQRYATRVTYAEARVVLTNVDGSPPK